MKKLETLIPIALNTIESIGIARNGNVSNEYIGYVSGFSATIIQAGLLAAVVLYSKESSNNASGADRRKIPGAIKDVLVKKYENEYESGNENKKLHQIVMECQERGLSDLRLLRERILDIAVSLKMSMRTFKLVANKENGGNANG